MGGDFGFWNLSIQCAARHMDISAFVRLQDLGFGRAPPVSPSSAYSTMRKELALSFSRCFASAPTVSRIDENRSNVFLCSPVFSGGRFWSSARRTPCFPSRTLSNKMVPLNVILREQLNVKQRQRISETPAKGGGGLVENLLLVTWPDGRLSGRATLARLSPSGLSTHRVLFEGCSAD
jgi:hypothetical protein